MVRVYLEAHHILSALVDETFHLRGGKGKGVAHLAACRGIILEIGMLGTGSLKFLGGIEGDVCLVGIEQLLYIFAVDIAALALLVRTIIATLAYTLVDLYAEPCERFIDILLGTRHETSAVGILDTENHVAPMFAGKKIVIKGCAHTSDMKRSRG